MRRKHKQAVAWALSLCLFLSAFGCTGYYALAADIDELEQAAEEAKAAYDAAKDVYDSGSLGFFEYMGSENALAVLNDGHFGSYQDYGSEKDATSLENMYWAIRMIFVCNALRAQDDVFVGAGNQKQLMVNDTMMAVAQKQCNAASQMMTHSRAYCIYEILAWGYNYKNLTSTRGQGGPFDDWYYIEKGFYLNGGGDTSHYQIMMMDFNTCGAAVNLRSGYASFTSMAFTWKTAGETQADYDWWYSGKGYTLEDTDYTASSYYTRFLTYYDKVNDDLETAEQAYIDAMYALSVAKGESVEVTAVTLNETNVLMGIGGNAYLTASLTPLYTTMRDITWTSADTSVATVSAEGKVTAVGLKRGSGESPGSVRITATSENGVSASCYVAVLFRDVMNSSDYYYTPVYWAYNQGITTGRSSGDIFDPSATCTRAEIVTFLWRLAGKPEPTLAEGNPFKDVSEKTYYYKAVLWAVENGITTGRAGTDKNGMKRFDPSGTCTRREIVTFLWRYAGRPSPSSLESGFSDVTDSSAYYYKAVLWAVEQGITTGKAKKDANGGTRFDPTGACTRAMSVTFLYRYAK